MNSRPWVAEQIGSFRSFRAPFLAFSAILAALLLIPDPVLMLTSGGSHSPFVSLFVTGITSEVLPPGWTLYHWGPGAADFEIYVTASVMLALLISSPIISYQIMKFIAPALAVRKRTLYSLVACATVLLATGALFGVFFYAKGLIIPFNVGRRHSAPLGRRQLLLRRLSSHRGQRGRVYATSLRLRPRPIPSSQNELTAFGHDY